MKPALLALVVVVSVGINARAQNPIVFPIDVRDYGARCDATYNVNTQAITGTDDSTALQNALNATPPGSSLGITVLIPGHCRFTTALTVSNSFVTIRGTSGGWKHAESQDTASALIFDSTSGTAITVTAQGFRMQDVGLFVKNGIIAAVSDNIGTAAFEGVKLFNINGACSGCAPTTTSGKGLDTTATANGGWVIGGRTQISGFLIGVDFQNVNPAIIYGGSQINNNAINVRVGNVGANTVTVRDSVLQDAGCVSGGVACAGQVVANVQVLSGSAVTVDGNYMEIGASIGGVVQHGLAVDALTGTAGRNNIRIAGNYIACNSETSGNVIQFGSSGTSGLDIDTNVFNSCTGLTNVFNNAGAASGVVIHNQLFPGGAASCAVYKASSGGMLYDDGPCDSNLPAYYSSQLDLDTASSIDSNLCFLTSGAGKWCLKSLPGDELDFVNSGGSGETTVALKAQGAGGFHVAGNFSVANLLLTNTPPTISSGFGTSPSVTTNNGTASFTINVGTGGTATSGVIGLSSATNGWNCQVSDLTTQDATRLITKQIASTTSSATIANFSTSGVQAAWAASDILAVSCFAR